MKIHELAKELDMDAKEVLEKAQSMGIEVKDKDSTLKEDVYKRQGYPGRIRRGKDYGAELYSGIEAAG